MYGHRAIPEGPQNFPCFSRLHTSRVLQFLRRLFKSAVNVNRALLAQLVTLAVDPRVTPRLLFIMLRMF